jgi:hypothetical protein
MCCFKKMVNMSIAGKSTVVIVHQPPVNGQRVFGPYAITAVADIAGRKKISSTGQSGVLEYAEVRGTTPVAGPVVQVTTFAGKRLNYPADRPVLQINPSNMSLHRTQRVTKGSWLPVIRIFDGRPVLRMDIVIDVVKLDHTTAHEELLALDYDNWAFMAENGLLI